MRDLPPSHTTSPQKTSVNLKDDPTDYFDPNEDRIKEECGVFGIFGMDNAASLTALGMHALQHRGQEACGIASFDGEKFHTERHMGCLLYTSPSPRD